MGPSKPSPEIQKQQQGTRAPEKLQTGRVPYQKQAPGALVSGGNSQEIPQKGEVGSGQKWLLGNQPLEESGLSCPQTGRDLG